MPCGSAARQNRGAKPKYCDDIGHNPLTAHRERRKREADATGQRAEETGGQPVTIGLTRAAELVSKLKQLTAQHAEALARAITELRSAGDPESAEAEVYAARTSADQRVAAAEARVAEEINRRREAETERDQARGDRDQADDAAAQAITRMDELTRELTTLRDTTDAQLRAQTAAELQQARDSAQHDIGQARDEATRLVADATSQLSGLSRNQHAPSKPKSQPSSAPTAPRPRQPRKSPTSAPTPSASATNSTALQTPASLRSKKHELPYASAPNEQKPTSTPHGPSSNASPSNSTRQQPTPTSTTARPTTRHHAPAAPRPAPRGPAPRAGPRRRDTRGPPTPRRRPAPHKALLRVPHMCHTPRCSAARSLTTLRASGIASRSATADVASRTLPAAA